MWYSGDVIQFEDAVRVVLEKVAMPWIKQLPNGPTVKDIRWRLGEDSRGNDAVWVWVILADETPPEDLRHLKFQPFADSVRHLVKRALREGTQFSFDLLPYVSFRLENEQRALEKEGLA